MAKRTHTPVHILDKLRKAGVVLARGRALGNASRSIGDRDKIPARAGIDGVSAGRTETFLETARGLRRRRRSRW